MLGPDSKPSLGLDMTYTAIAMARNPATDTDLRAADCNMFNLL